MTGCMVLPIKNPKIKAIKIIMYAVLSKSSNRFAVF
jgi:hypothetical protein